MLLEFLKSLSFETPLLKICKSNMQVITERTAKNNSAT